MLPVAVPVVLAEIVPVAAARARHAFLFGRVVLLMLGRRLPLPLLEAARLEFFALSAPGPEDKLEMALRFMSCK